MSVERSDADGIENVYQPPGWINPDSDLVLTDANGDLVGAGSVITVPTRGGRGPHATAEHDADGFNGAAAYQFSVDGQRMAHGACFRDRRGLPRPVRDLRLSVSFGSRSTACSRKMADMHRRERHDRQPGDVTRAITPRRTKAVGLDAGATGIAPTPCAVESVAGAAPTRGVVPDHVTR